MKKMVRKWLAYLSAFVLALSLLPVNIKAMSITDEADLQDAINQGGSVSIDSNIELTKPLTISQDVTLTGNGSLVLSTKWENDTTSPITVEKDATLIWDGVTLDGGNGELKYGKETASAIIVKGTLILESGTITRFVNHVSGNDRGIIYVDGGTFHMNGGSVSNNKLLSGNYQGIIYLTNGASFDLQAGMISENLVYDTQGASGIIKVDNINGKNVFVMNGGMINENGSTAVFVGSLDSRPNGVALFTMNGGAIADNKMDEASGNTWYGRAIYATNGGVTLNGGTISGNESQFYGGAVYLVANSLSDDHTKSFFIMNDGIISENHSMYGGGILVTGVSNTNYEYHVELNGGSIVNNSATRQGGGIYIVRGQTVHLHHVVIYENTATKIGGGIWTCSTGDLRTYITNGGAVFDNHAEGDESGSAGADLAFVQHEGESNDFILAERIIGGGKVSYYEDGGVYAVNDPSEGTDGSGMYYLGVSDGSARFDANDPGEAVTVADISTESYALISNISDNAKSLSKESAALVITGNTADRGAGIGANGSVVIGDAPNEENVEYKLMVNKEWNKDIPENKKTAVEVALMAGGYELDTVILNADNNWSASFTGLPEGNYAVREVHLQEDMEATYSNVTLDGSTYKITITNNALPVTISGTKTWDDANDQDGIRPESIIVRLWADGKEVANQKVTAEDNWTWVFENLARYQDGKEIKYTISEDDVDGYQSMINGYDITNHHQPKTMNITVSKKWDDHDNEGNKRPESIVVKLFADGTDTGKTITLSEENQWTDSFDGLAVNKNGQKIVYSISEVSVEGYTTKITGNAALGYTITNTLNTTTETSEKDEWPETPNTGDSLHIYLMTTAISLLILCAISLMKFKKEFSN